HFERGLPPEGFLARLETILELSSQEYWIWSFMGTHNCSICIAELGASPKLVGSSENIFMPGINSVYIAPGGIKHYVSEHSYLPPLQFIEAVFACPQVDSPEFQKALQISNAGIAIPLLRSEEAVSRAYELARTRQKSASENHDDRDMSDNCQQCS